jgi:glycosyltransferase involved in cell wall biosynthesis
VPAKIAFLLQDFAIGGIETCLYNIARELKSEFEFHFIATHVKHIQPKFNDVGRAVYLPIGRSLVKYLKENKFSIAQTHNMREYVDAALDANVPIIIERIAGNRVASNRRDGVDWVIASNKGTLPLIEKTISSDRISVVYNGVDIEFINSAPADRCGFSSNDVIVGRVSRLGRGQNIHMLIRAMTRVNAIHPEAKLVIVGGISRMPGAENVLPELLKLAKPLGKNVVFTGEIDQPFSLVNGFDIATCVSNHEGVPNSLIEAMACRKPIVSTDVGQVSELVDHEKNGFLFPCNDEESLVNLLMKLIPDASLQKKLGENGFDKVRQHFDIRAQAQIYKNLYQRLLEEKKIDLESIPSR